MLHASYYHFFLSQFITRCDEVYLMSNGKIIQSGTHEGLMQNSPEYASLIKNCAHDNSKKHFVWVLWFVEIMVFCYVYLTQLKWFWLFQARYISFFNNFMFTFLNLHLLSPSCYSVTYEQLAWSFCTIFFFQYDDGIHLLYYVDHPKVVPLQLTTVSPMNVLLLEASVLGSKPHCVACSYACVMFILWNLIGK